MQTAERVLSQGEGTLIPQRGAVCAPSSRAGLGRSSRIHSHSHCHHDEGGPRRRVGNT